VNYKTKLLINTVLVIVASVVAFLVYDAIVPTEIPQ
jgi:hypothetical protein